MIFVFQDWFATGLWWVGLIQKLRESCFGSRQVELINDFVAQGYGMLTLADDEAMYNYVYYVCKSIHLCVCS